jgi:hypothetical protein
MLRALLIIPLLVVPVFVYFLLSALFGGTDWLHSTVVSLSLMSGVTLSITGGTVFLAVCVSTLFVEIVKSSNVGRQTLVNHGLSVVLLISCVVMFFSSKYFSTNEFFLVVLICLIDVVAGFVVTATAARRDFGQIGIDSDP